MNHSADAFALAGLEHVFGTLDIYLVKSALRVARFAKQCRDVIHDIATLHRTAHFLCMDQVAYGNLHAFGFERFGCKWIAHQCTNSVSALHELAGEVSSGESGRSGYQYAHVVLRL
jgi:hypothetical protein